MQDEDAPIPPAATRRQVLGTGGAVTGSLLMVGLPDVARAAGSVTAGAQTAGGSQTGAPVDVTLQINGHVHRLRLDPRTTLLDALREHVAMTGTKKGLRSWPVRRVHCAAGWQAHRLLPHPGGYA